METDLAVVVFDTMHMLDWGEILVSENPTEDLQKVSNAIACHAAKIILRVQKNSVEFSKLRHLKEVFLLLRQHAIDLSIVGIPYCVVQYLFGGVFYTQYRAAFVGIDAYIDGHSQQECKDSFQLLDCKRCIKFDRCYGLGIRRENHSMWNFRLKHEIREKAQRQIGFPTSTLLNENYDRFVAHCTKMPLDWTDRTLRYSDAYLAAGQMEYDERFVYYCRYLLPQEADQELKFLGENISSLALRDDLAGCFSLPLPFSGLAYSVAAGRSLRESIYFYFHDYEDLSKSMRGLHLRVTSREEFEAPYFFGVDYELSARNGYKVYSKVNCPASCYQYLRERYSITLPREIMDIGYNIVLGRRFSNSGELVSVKIEFNVDDHRCVESVVYRDYELDISCRRPHLRSEYYALDFDLRGSLRKVTAYRTNLLPTFQ